MRRVVVALLLAAVAQGHGGHEAHDGPAKGETIQQYAQRHVCPLTLPVRYINLLSIPCQMSKEHHM